MGDELPNARGILDERGGSRRHLGMGAKTRLTNGADMDNLAYLTALTGHATRLMTS